LERKASSKPKSPLHGAFVRLLPGEREAACSAAALTEDGRQGMRAGATTMPAMSRFDKLPMKIKAAGVGFVTARRLRSRPALAKGAGTRLF